MIKPLESQLADALCALADYSAPDQKPRSVADYDAGIATAEFIVSAASRVMSIATEILFERRRDRSDFIEALAERATDECERYNVQDHHL